MKNVLKELLIMILTYYKFHKYEGYMECMLLNTFSVKLL